MNAIPAVSPIPLSGDTAPASGTASADSGGPSAKAQDFAAAMNNVGSKSARKAATNKSDDGRPTGGQLPAPGNLSPLPISPPLPPMTGAAGAAALAAAVAAPSAAGAASAAAATLAAASLRASTAGGAVGAAASRDAPVGSTQLDPPGAASGNPPAALGTVAGVPVTAGAGLGSLDVAPGTQQAALSTPAAAGQGPGSVGALGLPIDQTQSVSREAKVPAEVDAGTPAAKATRATGSATSALAAVAQPNAAAEDAATVNAAAAEKAAAAQNATTAQDAAAVGSAAAIQAADLRKGGEITKGADPVRGAGSGSTAPAGAAAGTAGKSMMGAGAVARAAAAIKTPASEPSTNEGGATATNAGARTSTDPTAAAAATPDQTAVTPAQTNATPAQAAATPAQTAATLAQIDAGSATPAAIGAVALASGLTAAKDSPSSSHREATPATGGAGLDGAGPNGPQALGVSALRPTVAAAAAANAQVGTALANANAADKHARGDIGNSSGTSGGVAGASQADPAQMNVNTTTPATDVTPTPTLKVAAGVDTPEFGQGLATRVSWMVDNNLNGAKLQVNPPQLGPIEVRIAVQGSHAQVWMASHSAVTRDALESSSPKLREMLGAQGFGQVSVDISQRSFQERPSQAQPYEWTPSANRGASTVPVSAASTSMPRTSNGVVDAYA